MIRYTDSIEGIMEGQLAGFFVDWPNPPSPATHMRILEGSGVFILAIDDAEPRVVGFVTAVTDGVLAAYVPFLEVVPSHRGQGIGRELMDRVMEKLGHLYMVDLICDETAESFYASLGMKSARAMTVRRYDRQSGTAPEGE